ncbi:recombinase family protein [Actinomadura gamaensis]|uniref:Recombinase family protein n=1 Tax=Actinomadura gamaensis TaxID=1763541 RepID=A0ABV9UBU1_9ACTN
MSQQGTHRERPGLDEALAAVRAGDTFAVPKLDRLARSVPDARDIGDALVIRGIRLSLGGSIYGPAHPMSKMFFTMLAVFAELMEVFSIGRATVYRTLTRSQNAGTSA